jgi:hypothetical protein
MNKGSLKSTLAKLGLSLFSVVITLLLLEASLRLYQRVRYQVPFFASLDASTSPTFSGITLDETLGWRSTPDYYEDGTRRNSDGSSYPVHITIASNGFRQYGDVNTTRPKVLVLGDSITQAMQVSDTSTYYAIIGQTLDVEIFAYGAGGLGSLQEYMILDRYFDEIKPDLVIWQFCYNDLFNNVPELEMYSRGANNGMQRPYWVDGEIKYYLPKPFPELREFALKYSRLLYWLLSRVDIVTSTLPDIGTEIRDQGVTHPGFQKGVQVTSEMLARVRTRIGDTPAVAILCSPPSFATDSFRELSEANGFAFVDTGLAVQKAKDAGEIITIDDNAHWNEKGSEVAASAIIEYLNSINWPNTQ